MSMMPRGVLNMPDKIGNYEVESIVGEGTMGVVYKGKDPKFKRHVALKTIHQHLLTGPDDRLVKRSYAEAQALGGLNHANIVTIYDLIDHDGMPVIVMEFAEGKTLFDHLATHGKVSVRDAIKIIAQVLDALEYAHGRGLVHRDIKPANIMIRERSSIKVMDFGVAKIQDSDVTLRGEVFGAPNYMSPEQWRGKEVDIRTDIFAVGVLFYQLLTGVKPFEGENFHQTRENVLTLDPDPPSYINPTLPSELNAIVLKAMAREREQRYQSAAEFRHAIEVAEETIALPPKDPTLPGMRKLDGTLRPAVRPSRPAWLVPGAAAAVAVLLGATWFLWPAKTTPIKSEPAVASPVVVAQPVPPPAPVIKAKGRVDIRSEPSGASIAMINGESLGITPTTVSMEPGLYQLILKLDGYEPATRSVDVLSDQTTSLTETLSPTAPPAVPTAGIKVESLPVANPSAPPGDAVPEPNIDAAPRPSRIEVQRELQLLIRKAGFPGIRVAITRNYVAIISGTVARVADKEQVISIVQNHPIIKDNFIDRNLHVGGASDNPRVKLTQELRAKLRGQKVVFKVMPNSEVVLGGRLPSQEQMDRIIQIVQSTEGVTGVVNKLTVRGAKRLPSETPIEPTKQATLPIERLVKNINGALSQAKLQGAGSKTQIVAKNTGWNVIVLIGAAERQDQAHSAMQLARHAASGQVQVKNDITVLGN
jgi:serine/threonine protein kinase